MKYIWFILFLSSLAISTISAQTDDVYYPDDVMVNISQKPEFDYSYDFYYTSRIRRFHRPLQGFSFFDPYYIDMAYYDPFMRSVTTLLIYDEFYSQREFSRFNYWTTDQFSMNSFEWFGSPLFMPSYNFYNFSQNNNNNQVEPVNPSNRYYGPRKGGGSVGPLPSVRNSEIGIIENSPRHQPTGRNVTIEKSARIPSTSSRGFESPSSSQSWSMPRNARSSSLPSNSNISSGGRSTSAGGRVINQ